MFNCKMDVHSLFLEMIVNAEYISASETIHSIPHEFRFAYQFLLDEINENYDCPDILHPSPLAVRAATIRCIYRKKENYHWVLERANDLRKSHDFPSESKLNQFWLLYNDLTLGFAYHSMGKVKKAENIYLFVAKNDQEIVQSALLEIEARVTLIELYLDNRNEEKYLENKRRLLDLLNEHSNPYLQAIFLIADSEWIYQKGQYRETIALLNEAANLLTQINQNSYSGRVLSRLARLYQELGQFEEAVDCFDRAINLFKLVEGHPIEKSLLFKSRSQLKYKVADPSAKDDLLIALDFVKKVENPLELGKIYFLLVELGFNTGDLPLADKYFPLLEDLCALPECISLVPYLEYAKVLRYRSQERLVPMAFALKLLQKLNETENLPFNLKISVNYSLLELYLSELTIFFNNDVMEDINKAFSTLFHLAKSFPSKLFEIRLLLLNARFSIIIHDPKTAEEMISMAEQKAKKWNIPSLIELVEKEREDLNQKTKAAELFMKTFKSMGILDELRGSELTKYLDTVKKILLSYGA